MIVESQRNSQIMITILKKKVDNNSLKYIEG